MAILETYFKTKVATALGKPRKALEFLGEIDDAKSIEDLYVPDGHLFEVLEAKIAAGLSSILINCGEFQRTVQVAEEVLMNQHAQVGTHHFLAQNF